MPTASSNRNLALRFRAITICFTTLILLVATVPLAQAVTFKVLYTFAGTQGGGNPYAGLSIDHAGSLYGTAYYGGTAGVGTVFRLSNKGSGWVFTPLYNFQGGSDGAHPAARVVFGPDGSLYGTTSGGGNGSGTVFNLKPPPRACTTVLCPWSETVLYRFTGGSDGASPVGDLIFDQSGNIYGATVSGGTGAGVVYKLTYSQGSWAQTVLYRFSGGNDGGNPNGGVIFDQTGNLYGVTANGGALSDGVLYQLVPSGSGWTENPLFDFGGRDFVKRPVGSLVFDLYGNLFGASQNDNVDPPYPGILYEIQYNTWTLTFTYDFHNQYPYAGLAMDATGNLYGDSDGDHSDDYGEVYKLTASGGSWGFGELYMFPAPAGPDGGTPYGPVVVDPSGNVYGTCSTGGGSGNFGTVWEITP